MSVMRRLSGCGEGRFVGLDYYMYSAIESVLGSGSQGLLYSLDLRCLATVSVVQSSLHQIPITTLIGLPEVDTACPVLISVVLSITSTAISSHSIILDIQLN